MSIRKILYSALIFLVVTMMSCDSKMYFTTLDIMKPAEVTFPLGINNVVIVNNSVPQPAFIGHYNTQLTGNTTTENLRFDSAAIFTTSALKDALRNKGFFNNVELSLTNQNFSDSYKYINKLSSTNVKALCNMYNANAVISLERIFFSDNISEFYLDDGEFYNELDVKVKTEWSIYDIDSRSNTIQFVDSFLWQSSNYDRKITRDSLPKRYDALVDACILSGSNIADRMIPQWEKEDRYFFLSNNKLMNQAMDSVPYRKWEKAIELWKIAADSSKSEKIKYQSYNNIAVSYEIIGNIDNAIDYALKALNSFSNYSYGSDKDRSLLVAYNLSLKKRKDELKLLQKQLGN